MVILWQGGKEWFTSLSYRRANAIARPLRKLVMPSDEVGYYHVYNRCVRGGFLLAASAASGQSDPRKDWIQSHIQYLCQGFAVEVCDFCLMDNHFHLILRNRPDLVPRYSDEEVVRRWWHIQRKQRGESELPVDPPSLTSTPVDERPVADASCIADVSATFRASCNGTRNTLLGTRTVKTVNMASSSRNDSGPHGFWMTKHCWLAACM